MIKIGKKKNTIFNKLLFVFLAILILFLLIFVVISTIYLGPIDKNNESYTEFVVVSGSSKNKIAEDLEEAGLIKNALFFKVYIRLNSSKELYAGTYNLSKSMSVDEIIDILNSNNSLENETLTITFIEGKRLTDYAKKISEYFDYQEEDIIEFLDSTEYIDKCIKNYWFITDEIKNDDIYHPLEGYIFPDTYNFKKSSTLEEIANILISTMGQKLDVYKEDIELSNLSVHELLTLSSIVELEGAGALDRAGVAGVFYNRLEINEPLGSDVTTYYGVNKDFSKDLSKTNLKSCNGYNTRMESTCPIIGLPVGPIASPSLASISAAIEPTDHEYYFFVADKNKKTYFNVDNAGHNQTVAKLKKEGLWYEY